MARATSTSTTRVLDLCEEEDDQSDIETMKLKILDPQDLKVDEAVRTDKIGKNMIQVALDAVSTHDTNDDSNLGK